MCFDYRIYLFLNGCALQFRIEPICSFGRSSCGDPIQAETDFRFVFPLEVYFGLEKQSSGSRKGILSCVSASAYLVDGSLNLQIRERSSQSEAM